MRSVVFLKTRHPLNGLDRETFFQALRERLASRVTAAYVFGSVARGTTTRDSDVDLILVTQSTRPFVERGRDFFDLHELAPRLDLLVYTPEEFAALMRESVGFWKSVKESMVQIL